MITIAGRQLDNVHIVNTSPLDHPIRTIFFLFPIIVFVYYSLKFFSNLNKGVTLAIPKKGLPILKIVPGKIKNNPKYILAHYDNPYLTAILGLFFFMAAEFFIVIAFKTFNYTFV